MYTSEVWVMIILNFYSITLCGVPFFFGDCFLEGNEAINDCFVVDEILYIPILLEFPFELDCCE